MMETLHLRVGFLGFVDGTFKGLIQVPRMLALFLVQTALGQTSRNALYSTFLVFSLPYVLIPIVNVLCGWLGALKGPYGGLRLIPTAKLLRGAAMLLLAWPFLVRQVDFTELSALSVAAAIIGEFGLAIRAGAFEDGFRRTVLELLPSEPEQKAAIKRLTHLEQCFSQAGIFVGATGGTVAVTLGVSKGGTFEWLVALPFLTSAVLHALAAYTSWRWSVEVEPPTSAENGNPPSNWSFHEQVYLFFAMGDFLWCLGFGACVLLNYLALTLTPLHLAASGKPGFEASTDDPWRLSLLLAVCAAVPPLSRALIGFAQDRIAVQQKSQRIAIVLPFLMVGWCILTTIFSFAIDRGFTSLWIVIPLTALLSAGWMLLFIPGLSLRNPLANAAERAFRLKTNNGERIASTNHTLYFSLIEAMRDSVAALFGLVLLGVGNRSGISMQFGGLAVAAAGFFVLWHLWHGAASRHNGDLLGKELRT